jgi:type IV pilus assembly protein PilP
MRPNRGLWLVAVFVLAACEDEIMTSTYVGEPEAPAEAKAKTAAGTPTGESDEAPPAVVEFQESDFTESERSRDPFREFTRLFSDAAKERVKTQRDVVLDQYGIEELRLIGIVSRITPQRAMLVDPTGKGHVIVRGQFIGRPEIVQGGRSGADYEIHWRVERIRERDIILVRDDPANPDVPSATRVIALRPEEMG